MQRHLFLVAYDIASNRSRNRARREVKGNAIGGQKSLFECWLTTGELQQLMAALRSLIDPATDRIIFVQLDPRARIEALGRAVAPVAANYFYQG
ncbi:CRISPR-associated endonuclease Cas2 [Niveibacterium sp. 24ML]|uniref:CRISPR-associated endonuclease Cas2 n=1 Tax=Niveibacterium sp. 24ML TaxID=2985512 RepID=UPI00226D67B6|nr:CRISPR-associated endonuclease Cas2 [Niveibacterium sp. 24ML]MCX9157921.1 CRISPR-associated endonuclease Cas2 [Niveibacterium sp. 24ML]